MREAPQSSFSQYPEISGGPPSRSPAKKEAPARHEIDAAFKVDEVKDNCEPQPKLLPYLTLSSPVNACWREATGQKESSRCGSLVRWLLFAGKQQFDSERSNLRVPPYLFGAV